MDRENASNIQRNVHACWSCGNTGYDRPRVQGDRAYEALRTPYLTPKEWAEEWNKITPSEEYPRPTLGFKDGTESSPPAQSGNEDLDNIVIVANEAAWDITDSEDGYLTPESGESERESDFSNVSAGQFEPSTGSVGSSKPIDLTGGDVSGQGHIGCTKKNGCSNPQRHTKMQRLARDQMANMELMERKYCPERDEELNEQHLQETDMHSSNIQDTTKEESQHEHSNSMKKNHVSKIPRPKALPALHSVAQKTPTFVTAEVEDEVEDTKEAVTERLQVVTTMYHINPPIDGTTWNKDYSSVGGIARSTRRLADFDPFPSWADQTRELPPSTQPVSLEYSTPYRDQTRYLPPSTGLVPLADTASWHWTHRYCFHTEREIDPTSGWKETFGWWAGTVRQELLELADREYCGNMSCVTLQDCQRTEGLVFRYRASYQRRWEITPDAKKQHYEQRAVQSARLWDASLEKTQEAGSKSRELPSEEIESARPDRFSELYGNLNATVLMQSSDASARSDTAVRITTADFKSDAARVSNESHNCPPQERITPVFAPSDPSEKTLSREDRFTKDLCDKGMCSVQTNDNAFTNQIEEPYRLARLNQMQMKAETERLRGEVASAGEATSVRIPQKTPDIDHESHQRQVTQEKPSNIDPDSSYQAIKWYDRSSYYGPPDWYDDDSEQGTDDETEEQPEKDLVEQPKEEFKESEQEFEIDISHKKFFEEEFEEAMKHKSEEEPEEKPEKEPGEEPEEEPEEEAEEYSTEEPVEKIEEETEEVLVEEPVEKSEEEPEEEPKEEPKEESGKSRSAEKPEEIAKQPEQYPGGPCPEAWKFFAVRELSRMLDRFVPYDDKFDHEKLLEKLFAHLRDRDELRLRYVIGDQLEIHRHTQPKATAHDLPFLLDLIHGARVRKRQSAVSIGFCWIMIVFSIALNALIDALRLFNGVTGCFELLLVGSVLGRTFWVAFLSSPSELWNAMKTWYGGGESFIAYYDSPEGITIRNKVGKCDVKLRSIAYAMSNFIDSMTSVFAQDEAGIITEYQIDAESFWICRMPAYIASYKLARDGGCNVYRADWMDDYKDMAPRDTQRHRRQKSDGAMELDMSKKVEILAELKNVDRRLSIADTLAKNLGYDRSDLRDQGFDTTETADIIPKFKKLERNTLCLEDVVAQLQARNESKTAASNLDLSTKISQEIAKTRSKIRGVINCFEKLEVGRKSKMIIDYVREPKPKTFEDWSAYCSEEFMTKIKELETRRVEAEKRRTRSSYDYYR